ncbi:MAG: hypothetical protein Q9168_004127 [Polycauliona sp. 1 TL-2023]
MTHSKQVTQAFQASLASTPRMNDDGALSDAVANLQRTLDSDATRPLSPPYSAESLPDDENHDLSTLPMPPSSVVLKLLKRAKVERPRILDEYPALDLPMLNSYCQKVFFATEPYSIATFVIVNSSLISLLRGLSEKAKEDLHICQPDMIQYLGSLTKNVDIAVKRLPLVFAHSMENITALLSACSLAIESSIRASAWDLISTAARMALSLGFHRLTGKSSDDEYRRKKIVFWSIYAMDRSMALSLGRAPNIQDYDIQTERLSLPLDIDSPIGPMLACWVDVGELQGQAYYQLYSAHAQMQSTETKAVAAKQLAARCLEIQDNFRRNAKLEGHFFEGMHVQEIGFQSLLTMVYRMVPPDDSSHPLQFSKDCVISARAALRLHHGAWSNIGAGGKFSSDDWRIFIHWSTLFSPFVPFICVFGNVIAQSDLEDMALLGDFVSTLRSAAEQSHTVKKLYQACNSFHQIAKAYVARHAQHLNPAGAGIKNNFADWQHPMDGIGEGPFQPFSDSLVSQQDWDLMLNDWDLGLGTLDARQMSSFLDLLPNS